MPTQDGPKRIAVLFYRTAAGNEPVRDWLKEMSREDRRRIGENIFTVEMGWPVGMPVCRPLGKALYEVRTNLSSNRIARVIFFIDRSGRMVLLHAFVKKTQKTPAEDLRLADKNRRSYERGQE
jgi:phage-related protein